VCLTEISHQPTKKEIKTNPQTAGIHKKEGIRFPLSSGRLINPMCPLDGGPTRVKKKVS